MGTIVTTLELFHIWEPRACGQEQKKKSEEGVPTLIATTLLLTSSCSRAAIMGAI